MALEEVRQLPVVNLGSGGIVEEPVSSSTDGSAADVETDGHVAEEEPGGDKSLLGGAGHLLHDVQVRRVESEGSGGQTVSDQVDPEQLNGDEGFGQAEGGSQEDGDDFTDVGRDEVADELLHVVVDGATFLNGGDDGGEVVVGENHLRGGLGDGSSGSHGDTDFSLLEGGGVVDTVAGHGGNLLHGLQVLNDLGLVEGLDTGEHPGLGNGGSLLRRRQGVELTTGEGHAFGGLVLLEDANPAADGFSGVLVVAGDHDDADAGLPAPFNHGLDFHARGIEHADDADEGQVDLVLDELGGVLEVHVGRVDGSIGGGQSQAAKGVAAGTVGDGALHDLLPDGGGHGGLVVANPEGVKKFDYQQILRKK